MKDESFELLTKMYSEFTEFRKESKADIQGLKNDVLRIEHDHGQKLEALLDGYKQTYEKLEAIEEKVDNLSGKVDQHDIKIQVIEGGLNSPLFCFSRSVRGITEHQINLSNY